MAIINGGCLVVVVVDATRWCSKVCDHNGEFFPQ